MTAGARSEPIDVVTLEVIRNVLPAIANEMSYVLQRTSYNMMIYEVRDYCCGLLGARRTAACAEHRRRVALRRRPRRGRFGTASSRYGARGFRPGDVVITNHQRVAGQHLNNIIDLHAVLRRRRAVRLRLRRARTGSTSAASAPASAPATATRPVDGGTAARPDQAYGTPASPTRQRGESSATTSAIPESSMGDLKSQVAACRLAEKRIEEIVLRYGRDVVDQAVEIVFDQAEARCRAVGRTAARWRV